MNLASTKEDPRNSIIGFLNQHPNLSATAKALMQGDSGMAAALHEAVEASVMPIESTLQKATITGPPAKGGDEQISALRDILRTIAASYDFAIIKAISTDGATTTAKIRASRQEKAAQNKAADFPVWKAVDAFNQGIGLYAQGTFTFGGLVIHGGELGDEAIQALWAYLGRAYGGCPIQRARKKKGGPCPALPNCAYDHAQQAQEQKRKEKQGHAKQPKPAQRMVKSRTTTEAYEVQEQREQQKEQARRY